MKLVVDANLSGRDWRCSCRLPVTTRSSFETSALRAASDDEIIDYAISADRIVISHDTDFGTLLAYRGLSKPSFILIRSSDPVDVDHQARLVVANLDAMSDDLEAGAIAVFAPGSPSIRRLPLRGSTRRHSSARPRSSNKPGESSRKPPSAAEGCVENRAAGHGGADSVTVMLLQRPEAVVQLVCDLLDRHSGVGHQ